MGLYRGPLPHFKFGGEPTYNLAPLEFWPNFDYNLSHIDDYL